MDLTFSTFSENKSSQATLDHIKPRSRGGKTTWNNLILSCYSCNHEKDSKTIKPKIQPLNLVHNGLTITGTTGRMTYDHQLVKQVTERIYEATDNYAMKTDLQFPVEMVQSYVSQPVLQRRGVSRRKSWGRDVGLNNES
jgi:hypothetical protein